MTGTLWAQLDTDCEGPLCLNDNAFEACAKYVPQGDRFFTQVSRYDDYLADIVRREGYEAGSTLKLIAPFLKAYGLTNAAMLEYSRGSVDMVRGAAALFEHVRGLGLPAYVVSTSYQQFAHAVAERLGQPLDDVYCTPLDLDSVPLPPEEERELRALAARVAGLPPIELPETGPGEVSSATQEAIAFLEDLFWRRLPEMKAQSLIDSIQLVGAEGKARAIVDSLGRTGRALSDVVYVGDSITDVKALDLVREGGGLAVSFNGNRYATDAAEIACAADDAVATAIVIDIFAREGKEGVVRLIAGWPDDKAGQLKSLEDHSVAEPLRQRLESLSTNGIYISRTTEDARAAVRSRSMEMRTRLRGEHVSLLG